MAIQPIDLQILFSQLDRVAKIQSDQKAGVQLQQSLLGQLDQKKAEIRVKAVNETQDAGEGAEKIKERKGSKGGDLTKHGQSEEETEQEESLDKEIVQDPALGKNIDVSG